MIEINTLIWIIVGVITIGGGIVGFFTMQTRQNMKIKLLEDSVIELKNELIDLRKKSVKTGEAIVEINTKLTHIVESIDELKKRGV